MCIAVFMYFCSGSWNLVRAEEFTDRSFTQLGESFGEMFVPP